MVFEEQVGASASVEGGWEDADEDVGAVGWDGCEGGNVGKEENAIDAGIGYVGELF